MVCDNVSARILSHPEEYCRLYVQETLHRSEVAHQFSQSLAILYFRTSQKNYSSTYNVTPLIQSNYTWYTAQTPTVLHLHSDGQLN